MSERTFAGLTIEQLDALGREAGAEALTAAHAAGLPAPGMTKLQLASGTTINVITLLHPDGTLEIKDKRVQVVGRPMRQKRPMSAEGVAVSAEDGKRLAAARYGGVSKFGGTSKFAHKQVKLGRTVKSA